MRSVDTPLRVLIVEDSEDDTLLIVRELRSYGYAATYLRVETAEAMSAALAGQSWDVVISDFHMPQFSALGALELVRDSGLDLPFILVSGTIGEETAVAAMKAGARDFMTKKNLARLAPAIERELHEAGVRRDRKKAKEALRVKEEELAAMTQQLWQAAKLATMGELTASIAHELNNPLATVSLLVESLLAEIPEEEPKPKALKVIEREVERMGDLVANLLQFGRRSHPQISTLDLCDEIVKTLELIHYHFRNRDVTIVRDFAPKLPMVQADRQQVRQLFLNLFTNATDAMPKGGTLTCRLRPFESEKGMQVVIEIEDTGMGIAPDILPRVTEPFFTTKSENEGTGLGLAICRRIVQEHQGTIEIASNVGEGTRVRVILPVKNNANAALLIEKPAEGDSQSQTTS